MNQGLRTKFAALLFLLAVSAFGLLAGQTISSGISQGSGTLFAASDPALAPYSPGVVGTSPTLSYLGVLYTCAGTQGSACTYSTNIAAFPAIANNRLLCNISGGTAPPTGCTAANVATFGIATAAANLGFFAATTSAQLAGVISDATGSGALVFGTGPNITSANLNTPSALNCANCTNVPNTSVNGLGTAALQPSTAFTADPGANGVPYRSAAGTSAPATGSQVLTILGLSVPGTSTQLATGTGLAGVANGNLLQADGNGNIVDSGSTLGTAGISQGPLGYSSAALTPSAGTIYFPIVGGGPSNATEANVQWQAPSAGLVANLTVTSSVAVGTGDTIAFTVMQNGSATAITCSLSGTGAGGIKCSDSTHSVVAAKLDTFSVKAVETGLFTGITPTLQIGVQFGTGGNGSFISSATTPVQSVTNLATVTRPVLNINAAANGGAVPDTNNKSSNATWTSSSTTITLGTASSTTLAGDLLTIWGAGLQGTNVSVTACSVTSNIATITATNTFKGVELGYITGFAGGCSFLNGQLLNLTTGNSPSGSAFTAGFTHANLGNTSDTGTFHQAGAMQGTIVSVTDTTHFVASFTPQTTITGYGAGQSKQGTIWAVDNTTKLQTALTNACTLAGASRGNSIPDVFFGQGEYHISGQLTWTCGNLIGQPGSGGTTIVWDGANNSVSAIQKPSNGQNNGVVSGMSFVADALEAAPKYWIENLVVSGPDQDMQWRQLHFEDCGTACLWSYLGTNFHMLDWRFDQVCGYGINFKVAAGNVLTSTSLKDFTADFGSQFAVVNGCTASGLFNFDNSLGSNYNYAGIQFQDARIEDEPAIPWTSGAALVKYTSGNGGGTTYAIPNTLLRNITLSMVGTNDATAVAILGSDDTSGNACPIGQLTGIAYKTITKAFSAGSSNWCTGVPIVQPYDMSVAGKNRIDNCVWSANGCGQPGPTEPLHTTTLQSVTGTTTATLLTTYSIPASTIGVNGYLVVKAGFLAGSSNTGTCSYQVRFSNINNLVSGTAVTSISGLLGASSKVGGVTLRIANTGAANTQTWSGDPGWWQGNQNNTAAVYTAYGTSAQNTANSLYLMLGATNSVSGDTCSATFSGVEINP